MAAFWIYKELVLMFLIGVSVSFLAHSQLVNQPEIEDGGTFTVTCDARKLDGFNSSSNFISELSIERTVGASSRTLIGSYVPFPPPGVSNLTLSIPSGRRWEIRASGGIGGSVASNNKATISVTLHVTDAVCGDAGIYRCNAILSSSGKIDSSQNITITAKTEQHKITVDHHNGDDPYDTYVAESPAGQNMTLNCSITCPRNVTLKWVYVAEKGLMDYPFENDIKATETEIFTGSACAQYRLESALSLTVLPISQTYICVAIKGNVEVSRRNITVDFMERSTYPPHDLGEARQEECPDIGTVVVITSSCTLLGTVVALTFGYVMARKLANLPASKPTAIVYAQPAAEYARHYQTAYVTPDGYGIPRTS